MNEQEYHAELLRRAKVLARLWSRAVQRLAAAEGRLESEVIASLARNEDELMLGEQFATTGLDLSEVQPGATLGEGASGHEQAAC